MNTPPRFHPDIRSVEAARTEAEIVIFDVVTSVLDKVGLKGRDIDFLIINCRYDMYIPLYALYIKYVVPKNATYTHSYNYHSRETSRSRS